MPCGQSCWQTMLMAVAIYIVGSTAKHARQMPARLVARASSQQQDQTRKGPLDHLRDAAAVSKCVSATQLARLPARCLCAKPLA